MTYGFMVNFKMHLRGTKKAFRDTNVYRVSELSLQLNTKIKIAF